MTRARWPMLLGPDAIRVLQNTLWLMVDRVARLVGGVLVGAWIARTLGPEDFGALSFAIACSALGASVIGLGMESPVVLALTEKKHREGEVLGTAFAMSLVCSLVVVFVISLFSFFAWEGGSRVRMLTLIVGATLLFRPAEVFRLWFEYRVMARALVKVEGMFYAAFLLLRVIAIFMLAGAHHFAWIILVEGTVGAGVLVWSYARSGNRLGSLAFSKATAVHIGAASWPLLLSGLLVAVNLNVDKLIVGQLADATQLGHYAAAISMVSAMYFVPLIIGSSVAPVMAQIYLNDRRSYARRAAGVYRITGLIAVLLSLSVWTVAEPLVVLLFGQNYRDSAPILSTVVWSLIGVSQVSIRGRLLVIEGKQNFVALLVLCSASLNVCLNILLVPVMGAYGAALAHTGSWLAALVFPWFFSQTRVHAAWGIGFRSSRQHGTQQ